MANTEEVLAEIDTYTDYCKLIKFQAAKAEEYLEKEVEQLKSEISLVTAQFPYGVGPVIMAAKAAVTQVVKKAEEVVEKVAVPIAITTKLSELDPPTEGC